MIKIKTNLIIKIDAENCDKKVELDNIEELIQNHYNGMGFNTTASAGETLPDHFTVAQKERFAKLDDERNPEFTFSCTDTSILVMIAKGEINAKAMACYQLAMNGLDTDGNWVGFKKAEKIFATNVCQYMKAD